MKKVIIALFTISVAVGCSTSRDSTDLNERRANHENRMQPPSIDEIFKMDTNEDGKLAQSEIRGPLLRDFEKVDKDGDGFITRTELENAPKPPRRMDH